MRFNMTIHVSLVQVPNLSKRQTQLNRPPLRALADVYGVWKGLDASDRESIAKALGLDDDDDTGVTPDIQQALNDDAKNAALLSTTDIPHLGDEDVTNAVTSALTGSNNLDWDTLGE